MKLARLCRGYTLVELMVALVIACFLLAGLLMIVQSTRQTYNQQSALAQLQDSERLAMILMGDIIESAGYFPSPTTNTVVSVYPAAGTFAGGQYITGSGTATFGNTDTISVRFTPPTTIASSTNINTNLTFINCTGATDTVGTVYTDEFTVDANGNLVCTMSINGVAQTPVQLVSGVQSLQIWYGVATSAASGNNVDTYYTANQVTTNNDWSAVTAVKLRLTFANPLACKTAGLPCSVASEPALNYIERVVGVMARTGVTT
jgi:type IV pilus assembly protein PilW